MVAAIERDQVEQVAVFTRGCIGPFAGGAFAVDAASQANIEAAPRRAEGIADNPVASLAPSGREIMAADRFCIAGKLPG